MRYATLLLLVLTASMAVQGAQTSLKINAWVAQNDSVRPETIKTQIGTSDQPDTADGDYKIILADKERVMYNSYLPVNFRRLDTSEDVQEVLTSSKLPYQGNLGKVRISRFAEGQERVLWSYDLKKLCNRDGICNNYENHISCPIDCPITSPDGVCETKIDSFCDPDCAKGLDRDCEPKAQPGIMMILSAVGIVLAAIIILLLVFVKTHKKKHR